MKAIRFLALNQVLVETDVKPAKMSELMKSENMSDDDEILVKAEQEDDSELHQSTFSMRELKEWSESADPVDEKPAVKLEVVDHDDVDVKSEVDFDNEIENQVSASGHEKHQKPTAKNGDLSDKTVLKPGPEQTNLSNPSSRVRSRNLARVRWKMKKNRLLGHLDKIDLVSRAEVSTVPSSQCTYKCPHCKEDMENWAKLNRHSRSLHGSCVPVQAIEQCITKTVAYVCLICNKKVLCDKFFISNHVLGHHAVNFSKYVSHFDLLVEERDALRSILESVDVSQELKSKCHFACPDCSMIFPRWTKLKRHFSKSGHETIGKICKDPTKYATKVVAYSCQICHERIICDFHFLCYHVSKKHNMTMGSYRLLCGEFRTKIQNDLRLLVEEAEVSQKAESQCVFQCPGCKKLFDGSGPLRTHFKNTQHASYDISNDIGKYAQKIVSHVCKICFQKVACDNKLLTAHIRDNHKMVLSDYRAKFSTANTGEEGLSELLNNADVSEGTLSRCHFGCLVCQQQFKIWVALKAHFQESLHGTEKDFKHAHKFLVKAVAHVCKVCGEKVLCDVSFLACHLRKHDNLTVLSYRKLFNIETPQKEYASIRYQHILSNGRFSNTVIGNLCRFQCPHCIKQFKNLGTFRGHLTEYHPTQATIKSKIKERGLDCLTNTVVHKCRVCSRTLLCDSAVLKPHLKRIHGLTTSRYCALYNIANRFEEPTNNFEALKILFKSVPTVSKIIDNMCKLKCTSCSFTCITWPNLKDHISKSRQCFMEEYDLSEHFVLSVAYECALCSTKVPCDRFLIASHINNVHKLKISEYVKSTKAEGYDKWSVWLTHREAFVKDMPSYQAQENFILPPNTVPKKFTSINWGNACRYTCTVCFEDLYSWESLLKHLKKLHEIVAQRSSFKKYLQDARYHTCLVCSAVILCDTTFILYHVRYKHGLNAPEYKTSVLDNGGKELLSCTRICTIPLPSEDASKSTSSSTNT